jgi:hypothetical protein
MRLDMTPFLTPAMFIHAINLLRWLFYFQLFNLWQRRENCFCSFSKGEKNEENFEDADVSQTFF